MAENNPGLDRLLERLNELENRQDRFRAEIEEIRSEIRNMSGSDRPEQEKIKSERYHPETADRKREPGRLTKMLQQEKGGAPGPGWAARFGDRTGGDLETFIGENLISKIGIVITIIGVAIGARYAIDNDLISPLMRIILGYVLGGVLLLTSLKLKKSMLKFSAVLFSGSMSIFYIITFAAHSFYSLIPGALAFSLMVLITVITVAAAVYLNMQPVAHIALVGAYAVPFLVGGEGSISSFFIYMVIINAGVLFTAVYKYWKPLTYSAFFFTWMIFGSWFWDDYSGNTDFGTGITYATAFFLIIYMAALANKLLREKQFVRSDIWLILANAFVFYAFGFGLMSDAGMVENRTGLFTLANALIHGAAAGIVFRSGFSDRNLLYLITGLAITFLTLAVPIELEGSWVTLLWIAEAALLFTIGKMNGTAFYEKMSHPVFGLAFFALLIDWQSAYSLYQMDNADSYLMPILNIHFFTSLFFIAAAGWMVWKDGQTVEDGGYTGVYKNPALSQLMTQLMRFALIIAIYAAFRLEISGYFNQLYIESKAVSGPGSLSGFISGNNDLLRFGSIWSYNYTMIFIGGLILFLADRMRSRELSGLLFTTVVVCAALFLTDGLGKLNLLHDHYLDPEMYPDLDAGPFHIGIRYVCFLFLGFMLFVTGRMSYREYAENKLSIVFEGVAALALLWVLSNELMLWMDVAEAGQPYRLGFSILWGTYALALLSIGIRMEKKHLRIGAITLLAVTLFKLFFYDLADLDAIARTVVFVILGLLLLMVSYLYNKYRKELG